MTTSVGTTGTSIAGWTCQQCGAFVSNLCTHFCPTTNRFPNNPLPPAPPTELQRIAAALERIAIQLERGETP